MRQPLRIVNSYTQLLVEDAGDKLDGEPRQYLDRIQRAVKRLSSVIDGLLRLSRLGREAPSHEVVDLSRLARNVVAEFHASAGSRAVQFAVADGLVARGDPELLTQLLQNLLGNAFKFTSVREQAHVEFKAEKTSTGETVYVVRDNGVGFDMIHADKLFRAFERLHDVGEFEGTGIGLATVARIVQLHGGKVWAQAEAGKGASFFFTLGTGVVGRAPVVPDAGYAADEPCSPNSHASSETGKG